MPLRNVFNKAFWSLFSFTLTKKVPKIDANIPIDETMIGNMKPPEKPSEAYPAA
jgi:hypothetical protein